MENGKHKVDFSRARMRTVPGRGVMLRCADAGEGKPVVLVHGNG